MEVQSPSQQKIISAVKELLSKRSLSSVKATDIIAASGVSHQTFYRLFMDKYDAVEQACFEMLGIVSVIVGDNSTVIEHTSCLLRVVKSNGAFFRHVLSCPEGAELIKKAFIRLSEKTIDFKSSEQITSTWVFCLQQWSDHQFADSIDDMFYKIISCYPVGQVVFAEDRRRLLEKYSRYTMKELNSLCNAAK